MRFHRLDDPRTPERPRAEARHAPPTGGLPSARCHSLQGPSLQGPSLEGAALGQLEIIRRAIQSSQHLTCVSGRGGIAMGVIALVAGGLCSLPALASSWVPIWLAAATASVTVGGACMIRKARADGVLLSRGVARRFLQGLGPAVVAGAVISAAVIQRHGLVGQAIDESVLPGVWLLFYGAGVLTGGATSVRVLPVMGASFLALAIATFAVPALALVFLTAAFGGLHVVFGVLLEREHGG